MTSIQEARELTFDEVDAVAGGAHAIDFTIFGIRFFAGTTDDGATYSCAYTSTGGSCTWEYP
jgi:hypothetical protein